MRISKKQACDLVGHFRSEGYLNSECIASLRKFGMREKDAHIVVAILARIESSPTLTTLDSIKKKIIGLGDYSNKAD